MRFFLLLLVTIALCQAATITLIGRVKTDSDKPVARAGISVTGTFENSTDDSGAFKISLSSDCIEGERVILQVNKPGWVINHPIDGEWNLPNIRYQNVQTTTVILVPKGSKKLWTNERIERYVALLSDTIAQLKKEGNTPKPVDFTYYLKGWAEKYGFTPDQVKKAFDEWADSTKGSNDYRQLGLREFYLKNFSSAADYFRKDARQHQNRMAGELLAAYQSWKDAGASYDVQYRFKDALDMYDSAKTLVTIEKNRKEWAEILLLVGNAQWSLGIRANGDESMNYLKQAYKSNAERNKTYNRKDFPKEWAATQNNLGNVLSDQGTRTVGEEGNKLLAQAVEAYRNALQVRIREQLPQDWAATQNNLGVSLMNQGTRTSGEEGNKLMAQAVEAYRNALQVRTREQLPQDWAMTQNNLGNVLRDQGTRTVGEDGNKLLAQAVEAYRNALQLQTREQLPQQWATTQNNIGTALDEQGTRTAGEEGNKLLAQAVEAYRNALQVRTREQLPQDWAMTQNNLGTALDEQGTRTAGEEGNRLLAQAVEAYRNALQVYTREQLPQQWATSQNNLGNALWNQGTRTAREEGNKLLAQAVEAYRNALQVYACEQLPQQCVAAGDR
jgi:tetratricopeptide (TPR) repeat protein